MFVEVLPWLYVGSCSSGSDPASLKQLGIKTVVNVHSHVDPEHDGVKYLQMPLVDGPGNDWSAILAILDAVDVGRRSGRVLVHCCGGMSRSPFITLSYLVVKERMGIDEALYLVSRRHPSMSIHPNLIDLLKQNGVRDGGKVIR